MTRLLAAAVLVLVAATAQAQVQGKIITDFKGMTFGKDISEFKQLKEQKKFPAITFYSRYGDDKAFQGVPVRDMMYGFVSGKFAVVQFMAQGPSSFGALKAHFDSILGQPSQPKVNVKQYTYTAGDVTVDLNYDDTQKVVLVSYSYRPIMRQMMVKPQ
jgi:hypothetical protein